MASIEELEAIRKLHKPRRWDERTCAFCEDDMPCAPLLLLAHIDAQEKRLAEAQAREAALAAVLMSIKRCHTNPDLICKGCLAEVAIALADTSPAAKALLAQAAEIERLRTLGDALATEAAEYHNTDSHGSDCSTCAAVDAWREATKDVVLE